MKYVFYTNIVSPHQVPWCTAFVDLVGQENFYYVITDNEYQEREKLGWQVDDINFNVITVNTASELLERADILISGIRDVALFERRAKKGFKNFYVSERWFKPPLGLLRLMEPTYWLMCYRFVHLLTRNAGGKNELMVLPIGIHAARDMARLIGLLRGDIRCLWQTPVIEMNKRVPLSTFRLKDRSGNLGIGIDSWTKDEFLYGLDRMRLWGYFVEPTRVPQYRHGDADRDINLIQSEKGSCIQRNLQILWVGRMLAWKRVDTLVNAVVQLLNEGVPVTLKIVGHGPMENKLRQLSGRWLIDSTLLADASKGRATHSCKSISKDEQGTGITFHPPIQITEVRKLMREADVYVFPSDGGEGWGAVVNEALEEGCCVIGTREAGSSSTMIEHGVNGFLFHAGDIQSLVGCLKKITVGIPWLRDSGGGPPFLRGLHEEESKARLHPLWTDGDLDKHIRKQAKRTMDEAWGPEIAARKLFDFVVQVDNGSERKRI